MVPSTIVLEREGRSTVLDYTIRLVCSRHKGGSFSLSLTETSDIGDLHHPVAKRIRSATGFVDAVMSVMGWTELEIDYDVIVDEVCVALRTLDASFADSILDHIAAERSGIRISKGKMRA